MQKWKSEKGSITLFVLVSCIFFVVAVTFTRIYMQSKQVAVNREYRQVKINYEGNITDDDSMTTIYKQLSQKNKLAINIIQTTVSDEDVLSVIFDLGNTINIDVNTIKYGWGDETSSDTVSNWTYIESESANNTMIATKSGVNGSATYYLYVIVDEKEISTAIEIEDETIHVADKQGEVLSTDENTEVEDENGNKIVVPAGFFITDDADVVEDGIVIEDATDGDTAGSQFVWIPVGTINKSDGSKVEIELSRYTFDTDGTATKQGNNVIDDYYQELSSSTYGNTVAKDIEAFIESAETNGGYYLGRYEARIDIDKSSERGENIIVCTAEDYVVSTSWQLQAAVLCEDMYSSTNFISDLVNSYAWDTAIFFLQTCGNNSKYSWQTSLNNSIANYGTSSENYSGDVDVQCNVYDMASNVCEWSTETSSAMSEPCVCRGGFFASSQYYTCKRAEYYTDDNGVIGFRPILYL